MIKVCLFDLDGTLLDTLESIRYFLNKKLKEYSVSEISSEQTRYFVGRGARNLVKLAVSAGGMDPDGKDKEIFEKLLREFIDLYDSDPFYLTAPYSGISEMLDRLRAEGFKLAVISNKPDPTVKQLCKMFFGDKLALAYGGRENVPLKPDPCALFEICEQLGVKNSEVAYFGDTGVDMETGRRFGAKLNVGVLWGFRDKEELVDSGADVVVGHPSEIFGLLL